MLKNGLLDSRLMQQEIDLWDSGLPYLKHRVILHVCMLSCRRLKPKMWKIGFQAWNLETSNHFIESFTRLASSQTSRCSKWLCNILTLILQVIEAADVILEVLDARDPLGSRCLQVEKAVLDAGPSKRLVLVLNKIGMIGYLSYLASNL